MYVSLDLTGLKWCPVVICCFSDDELMIVASLGVTNCYTAENNPNPLNKTL